MKILKMTGRILGAVAAAVGLVAFIAPVFKYGLLNIGNLTGMALCGWMLVLCVTPLPRLFKRFAVTRWLFRVINVCYAVFLLYGAVVTGAERHGGGAGRAGQGNQSLGDPVRAYSSGGALFAGKPRSQGGADRRQGQ